MIDVTRHVLTPRRYSMQQAIGSYAQDALACEEIKDHIWDMILLRMTTSILTDQRTHGTKEITLDVPASWWQHFKRDHMPTWYLRWRPVRYTKMQTTVYCEHFRMFPKADVTLPEFLGQPVIYETFSESHWRPASQPATEES